jgi:thiol-disulfide isomerase/thioredoxin
MAKTLPARRWSVRDLSLAVCLVGGIGIAVILSYLLLRLFLDETAPKAVIDTPATSSSSLLFSFPDHPSPLPELRFVDENNQPRSLAEFRGRPILLNIWATWCVPCRKEMPSLARLQAKFDPSQFLVLALSVDRQGIPAVQSFFQELKLTGLGIYVDPPGDAMSRLRVPGLPTTVFVNAEGQEIGRKIGAAEWDSPEAIALLRDHLKLPVTAKTTGASK